MRSLRRPGRTVASKSRLGSSSWLIACARLRFRLINRIYCHKLFVLASDPSLAWLHLHEAIRYQLGLLPSRRNLLYVHRLIYGQFPYVHVLVCCSFRHACVCMVCTFLRFIENVVHSYQINFVPNQVSTIFVLTFFFMNPKELTGSQSGGRSKRAQQLDQQHIFYVLPCVSAAKVVD